jgi:hypothetical protein
MDARSVGTHAVGRRNKAKVSFAPTAKSKAGHAICRLNCIEMQRNPAHYSAGVRKHWACHKLWHLSLLGNGID